MYVARYTATSSEDDDTVVSYDGRSWCGCKQGCVLGRQGGRIKLRHV